MFIIIFLLLSQLNKASQQYFPIEEFLNVTLTDELSKHQYLCNGLQTPDPVECCSCDKKCVRYKNCCIDKFWNNSNPIPLDQYLEEFLNETDQYKDTSCEPAFPLAGKYNHRSGYYYMVKHCHQNALQSDIVGCKNLNQYETYEYNIPVFGSDNYLYKNSFCARCNNVENFDLVNITAQCKGGGLPVPIVPPKFLPVPDPALQTSQAPDATTKTTQTPYTTTKTSNFNLKDIFENCIFLIVYEGKVSFPYVQPCSLKKTRSRNKCEPTNKFYKVCNSYYGIMDTYANYHCFLCENGNTLPQHICPSTAHPSSVFTWSFTLRFSTQTNVKISKTFGNTNSDETYCDNNKMYNVFTNTCDEFTCSNGYEIIGRSCQKSSISIIKRIEIPNPSFDKCLLQQNNMAIFHLHSNATNVTIIESTVNQITNSTQNGSFIHISHNNINQSYYKIPFKENDLNLINMYTASSMIWETVDTIYIAKDNQIITELYGMDVSRTFNGDRLCGNAISHDVFANNFTSICSINLNDTMINYHNLTQWISFDRHSTHRQLSTCKQFHLSSSCKILPILNDYLLTKTLTLLYNNETFNVSQYTPLLKGVGICYVGKEPKPVQYIYKWMAVLTDWENYIGYIGTSLSILCYFIIIMFYLYCKELHNIPVFMLIGLCTTLFFTDVLFLVAVSVNQHGLACKLIGMFLHWGLLAIGSWVLVMGFDLLLRFGSITFASAINTKKRLFKYVCFVMLVPSLIVCVPITLNELDIYAIGYGKNGICFVYNFFPRIFFYILPLSLVFLAVGLMFIRIVTVMRKQELNTRKILVNSGRQERNLIGLTLKLYLVLGLIEIVGFIQISKNDLTETETIFNAVFAVLYTVVRSLRGIFLFMVYMCNIEKLKIVKTCLGYDNKQVHSSKAQTMEMYVSTNQS